MFWMRNKKHNIWRSDHAVWTTKLALTDFEKSVVFIRHHIFYGVESWSGVMECSIGVESILGVG